MLSTVLRTGAAAGFLAAVASAASAQTSTLPGIPAAPEPPRGTAQPPAAQPPAAQPGAQPGTPPTPAAAAGTTYRVKQILGSRMTIGGTAAVGTVDDIVFDAAGNLEYLVVANEGRLVTVPWDAARFDLKAQTGTLSIAPDVYRKIPTYTATTYPDFYAPAYRTEVYRYYGLTPRDLRRIDRGLDRTPAVPPAPVRPVPPVPNP
ncbi:MAG: hypothetical protein C0501_26220 [Isosphaera sp.]|nr:hypothetical protein [Isosphaera sp.]